MIIALAIGGALSPALGAGTIVRSGDTIQLGDTVFRLDGIDAPEVDQLCIDDHADPWSCGVEAREQLTKLIGGRSVRCDDLGPDKPLKTRKIGLCTVDGDKASLNLQIARAGYAVSADPAVKVRAKDDIAAAKEALRGLWKGCFVAPAEFRIDKKDGALLGASCRTDRDREIRAVLFPDAPSAPPGCTIKGKFAVRARVTGNIGIYHLQGCPSYPATTEPDRWFCSEDDARASGFRRAFNCRAAKK
ncbi:MULTISPECIES: thermonuclease family protein [unclassified Bradyrhizobium]|uniref:thermonuclease family protein n=1 Tax=unclassified Bradyrhizobium TaxID=2631580 RepID=UPI0024E0F05A|nr:MULTISPECIES: thermonuclease family protein [unclassified Bradyrhizobium]